MRTAATSSPKPSKSRPAVHRTSSVRLDPYAVAGTVTLQEWRRVHETMPTVHVVRPQETVSTSD